jgi:hypothetical protein
MKKSIILLTAILLAFVFSASCKPSVKNELKYFNNNQNSAKELMQLYPAFSQYLIKLSNSSAKAMAEAKKIKKAEKKAEAMKKANEIISDNKLYSKVRSYNTKKKECIEEKLKLSRIINSKYSYLIREGLSNANRAIQKGANTMAYADTTTEATAFEAAEKAYGIIYDATNDLKRRIKKIKSRKKKKRD